MPILPLNTSKKTYSPYVVSREGNSPYSYEVSQLSSSAERNGYRDTLYRTRIGSHPPLAYNSRIMRVRQMSLMSYTMQNPSGSFWYRYTGDWGHFENPFYMDQRPVSSGEVQNLKNSAIANANSRVKGQHYSAFETLYEGRKTVNMILGAVSTLVKSAREVKRGKFLQAAETLGLAKPPAGVHSRRDLESNWLEYRYGWIPLYSTIYGEMKRQYDLQRAKRREYTVTGFSEERFLGSYTTGWSPQNYGSNVVYVKKDAVGRHHVMCLVGYVYEIHNETLANTTSLGITNPALLAWEALPLSFVADWAWNVSDVLDQFDTWSGKQFLHGYITQVDRYTETRIVEAKPFNGYIMNGKRMATLSTERIVMTRSVLSSAPSIRLTPNLQLNGKRITDGIALFLQIFKH